jgi:uncharacterized DUF497 family protein
MKIEFDPRKSEKNARERGLPFELVDAFDWENAVYWEDLRFLYPEQRMIAIGFIGARLHFVCFAQLVDAVRVISFRKANRKEVRKYEEAKTAH